MKAKVRWTLIMVLMLFASFSLFAQKPVDLVGTWVGMATLEGETEHNELTLVLELEEGELSGHLSAQLGEVDEVPLVDITLEEDVFSFSLSVETPNGVFTLNFKMNVSGDYMEGELEFPELGSTGTWEATRQK